MGRRLRVLGGTTLVAASVVLIVLAYETPAAAGVAIAVPASIIAAATFSMALGSARRVHARVLRLLRLVRENHKRASTWNFRMTKALKITVPPPVEGVPGLRSARGPARSVVLRAVVAAAVACALVVVALVGEGLVREIALPLIWAVTGTGAAAVAINLVEHHVTRRQEQVEHVVAENHKRASVWNFHVSKALGIGAVPAAPTSVSVRLLEAQQRTPVTMRKHPGARALAESGIFDVEYYSALVDGAFATPIDAASHYLSQNAPLLVSPSPFLDTRLLPDDARVALRRGDPQPLVSYLRSEDATTARLSPLFDAGHAAVDPDRAAAHTGGVLGAWLEGVRRASPLAVPDGSPTSGLSATAVREAMTEHARAVRNGAKLAGPRSTETWDADAETAWLRDVAETTVGELPKVSVVMAVRDREDAVVRAIRSVQAQTHQRWQLLVVDDGSTDATAGRVAALAADDSRVTLVRGAGAGVSNARNLGLDAAEGDYIAFLDSDNEWVDGYLETMLRGMISEGLGAAYAATAMRSADGVRYRAYEGGLDDLLTLNHIDLNVFVVRADVARIAGRFDEDLRRWVDHDYAIKVAKAEAPALLPFIGCWYDDSTEAQDRITVRESEHWQWVVLGRHWVEWDAAAETVPGRLSVVIPTYNDSSMTMTAVRSVLQDADASGLDIEIVIVDNGSRLEVGQELLSHFGVGGRVVYHRLPRNLNFAIGCNVGLVMASGEHTLFLNNDTEVRSGALKRLLDEMAVPGVIGAQPLLVYSDETIQTAGTVFTVRDGLPNHLLVDHPPADALPLKGAEFHAVSAAALIMRTAVARGMAGFDAFYVNGMEDVDLCLRARESEGGHFAVVPDALVTHLESKTPGRGTHVLENRRIFLDRWRGRLPDAQHDLIRRTGFELTAVGTDGRDVPGPRPYLARRRDDARRRWGIKVASIPGARGDLWGDTHFAESLRAALEKAGQHAVVHRHGSHTTAAAAFDDVNLVIRGLDRVRPMPGQVNILWVISHPEDVGVEEVREFDLVCSASVPWSRKMSALSGREVVPLLQATDIERFHPGVTPVRFDRPIFVGGTHPGRERKVVSDALAAGIPIGVYGPGWDGMLPDGVRLGAYVSNEALAGFYRGAPVVLADHWDRMAEEGFIQNRIFDAVASGARVVSDEVEGIEELFDGCVRTYRTPEDLARLCDDGSDRGLVDDMHTESVAARVRSLHSFDRRAEQLVAAVDEVAGQGNTEEPSVVRSDIFVGSESFRG